MTLFKQIMLGIVFFIVLMLSIVAIKDYQTSSEFIKDQLSINARHTATSLGLAITTSLDELDEGIVEAIINPIFDSGYYKSITLVDASGNTIYQNTQDELYGISQTLMKWIDFNPPIESFDIIKWTKLGTISVQISPVFAYHQIQTILKELFITLGAVALGAFVLIYFALRLILAPLERVKDQAQAILEHEFIIQDKLPFTQEVRKMVLAMNSMVGKVKDIFEKESATLDKYNELLYKDEQSGLHNRRYFINKYTEYLSDEKRSSGELVMLSIKEIYNVKKYLGYESFMRFMSELSDILRYSAVPANQNQDVFRLNENDFALLYTQGYDHERLMQNIKQLFDSYKLDKSSFHVAAAVVAYDGTSVSNLLSSADLLIMQARSFSTATQSASTSSLGKQEYKQLILDAMSQDKFKLVSQDALDELGRVYHSEIYLRLDIAGQTRMAGYFMPIIDKLGLLDELDFYVLQKTLRKSKSTLAINISSHLITHQNTARLKSILGNASYPHIHLEISMSEQPNLSELAAFSKLIRHYGIKLGLDHFALSKEHLDALNELNVSYVKISAKSLLDLFEDKNTSGALNSLDNIIRSKGVSIIAIGVEDEQTKSKITALGIKLLEGRYISAIKPYSDAGGAGATNEISLDDGNSAKTTQNTQTSAINATNEIHQTSASNSDANATTNEISLDSKSTATAPTAPTNEIRTTNEIHQTSASNATKDDNDTY